MTQPEEPDDAALLRAHVAGDPAAFGVLVARHQDRLWAVALRTVQKPEEAADALQEALVSAFRRADSFRGEAQVTTWLHRIVVNACLDQLRRRRARLTESLPDDVDTTLALGQPETADPVVAGELRGDVTRALGALNADQRAAVVLVDMEGYSVAEAATILGCAPGTVKSRCFRGRARLLPLLTDRRPTRTGFAGNGGPPDEGTDGAYVTSERTDTAALGAPDHVRTRR